MAELLVSIKFLPNIAHLYLIIGRNLNSNFIIEGLDMGAIIGRTTELADLDEYCSSSKAELICIYGRRRVGKTYLVENYFQGTFSFSATASEAKHQKPQLQVFHDALVRYGHMEHTLPKDWFQAFERLRDILEAEDVIKFDNYRRVVFLDEFPWLATKRSDFLIAFSNFWNGWASRQDDIVVVVCGSATSWIIKNLFENTGSLYNRVTRQMYLAPFTLGETEQFAHALQLGWDRNTLLQAYMVFGGLPYYLEMLDRRKSLAQNIDALCLDSHGRLHNEVPHLMEATLGNSPLHRQILNTLATSKMGIRRADLATLLEHGTGGGLKRALDDLEKCGYIRKYKLLHEKQRPTVYQLIDPYLLFSFKFIEGETPSSWLSFAGTQAYYAWRGNVFEIMCQLHIPQIKAALGIAAVETQVYPWQSSRSQGGAQIDLLIERKDNVINLCEMKYTDEEFTVDKECMESLLRKRRLFQEETGVKSAVLLTLISASGIKRNEYSRDLAAVLSGDSLFDA